MNNSYDEITGASPELRGMIDREKFAASGVGSAIIHKQAGREYDASLSMKYGDGETDVQFDKDGNLHSEEFQLSLDPQQQASLMRGLFGNELEEMAWDPATKTFKNMKTGVRLSEHGTELPAAEGKWELMKARIEDFKNDPNYDWGHIGLARVGDKFIDKTDLDKYKAEYAEIAGGVK